MEFFGSAIETFKVLIIALGADLGVWGVKGYSNDNTGTNLAQMLMCHKVIQHKIRDSPSILFR